MKAIHLICLLLTLNLLDCRQPFNPPASNAQNNWLVVDGFINAGSDSTNIRLSRSQTLSDTNYVIIPENGATVSVVGSNNDIYPLIAMGNGLYSNPGLNLSQSENYHLSIITSNGEQFQSDSLLPAISPPIDSVSWQVDNTGMHIYVNSHDPTGNARFYKWDYTETWERVALYESELEYVYGQLLYRPSQNQIYTCWKTQNSTSLLIGSTAGLTQNIVYMQPVEFIPMGEEQVEIEYSIIVRQTVMDAAGFTYWQSLLSTTELTGGLFDPQPSEVTGNLHSLSNPKDPVFGWVNISTMTEKRIFISRNDFTYWLPNLPECVTQIIYPGGTSVFADSNYIVPIYVNTMGNYVAAYPECADCRYGGASNVKPSFWPF